MQTLLNKIELILDIAILILLICGLVVLAVLAIQNGVRASADATAESVEETPAETLPEVETTELAEETVAETAEELQPDAPCYTEYDSRSQYYATATRIVEFDWENDIVTCEDDMGFRWQFEGIEDWCIGDTATLVMYTNGTDLIYDDVIIRATYSTWELSK